jgi:competence protein ComGC
MKCRLNIQQRQKGIALVITLVMLAIVTVMAIVFLAVTRRERASVKVSEETAVAKDMADAALERVKTEALAIMNANGSRLHYDMLNSRAYFSRGKNLDDNNPLGDFSFVPGNPSPTNVAHTMFWPRMQRDETENYLRMLANLQYDPAVPVSHGIPALSRFQPQPSV